MITALLVAAAWGSSDDLLAPELVTLDSQLSEARATLAEAEALLAALGRAQNRMVTADSLGCDAEEGPHLAALTALLGQTARDRLQSVRAAQVRLARMQEAPTIRPLLDDNRAAQLTALQDGLSDALVSWQTAAAWQQANVVRWADCAALAPADGLPGVPLQSVAVVAQSERWLCVEAPGFGRSGLSVSGVVVVPDVACLSETDACDCEPDPALLPGAVLP